MAVINLKASQLRVANKGDSITTQSGTIINIARIRSWVIVKFSDGHSKRYRLYETVK